MTLFEAIITLMSLSIAFFLLLITTTKNINEALWEYGVLRSMGIKKDEGKRIYMYEAFAVVISAAILGVGSGFICSFILTAQFYLFIELPLVYVFPWVTLSIILGVSIITIYFSVYFPMTSVNKRQIAPILKGFSVE